MSLADGSFSGPRHRPILALGKEGMTEVQLAMARGLDSYDELVLIKTLRKRLANDPEVSKRFLAEARLSARLDHPNLVKVREVLETPVPRIITEHADGQTMSMIYQFASERFTVPIVRPGEP